MLRQLPKFSETIVLEVLTIAIIFYIAIRILIFFFKEVLPVLKKVPNAEMVSLKEAIKEEIKEDFQGDMKELIKSINKLVKELQVLKIDTLKDTHTLKIQVTKNEERINGHDTELKEIKKRIN